MKLQVEDINIKDIDKMLLNASYVSNNEISTTLYLSLLLGKPMLIEGPPGVGKTELAKVIAKSFDRDFFRIQCYEGILKLQKTIQVMWMKFLMMISL